MGNWVRISNEELEKSKEIIGLKKGELQIELVKALVKIDKAIKYIDDWYMDCHEAYEENSMLEEDVRNLLDILKGDSNE